VESTETHNEATTNWARLVQSGSMVFLSTVCFCGTTPKAQEFKTPLSAQHSSVTAQFELVENVADLVSRPNSSDEPKQVV